ncbi:MAG: hypothetical protein JOS17DRAFT_692295, partial [Linnemannia elongata]
MHPQNPGFGSSGSGGPPGSTAAAAGLLATPQLFWAQRRILGTNPFPRFQHTSSIIANGTDIFLYGGAQRGIPKGDLFVIDSASLQCQAVTAAGADAPMPKSGHSAVSIGQYILYFGGWDSMSGQCDDTLHVLHTARKEWNRPPLQGPLPTPRHSHSGCSVGTTMYIFGGQLDNFYLDDIAAFDMKTTDADYFYNDIWCFDPRALTWTPIPASGYLPTGRHGHACTVTDGTMYIFGGNSPDGTELNDAYAFKIHERRWYLFQNVGPVASPRSGHTMCTIKDRIFVLGGESEQTMQEDSALIHVLELSKIRYPDMGPQPPSIGQQLSDVPVSTGTPERPDRPDRPDRRHTQRPSSPATFGPERQGSSTNLSISQQTSQLMNPQLGQRPLTTFGAPPPRGASAGFQNAGGAGGQSSNYQAEGLSIATRRQTLKDDFQGGYGGAVIGTANALNSPNGGSTPIPGIIENRSSSPGPGRFVTRGSGGSTFGLGIGPAPSSPIPSTAGGDLATRTSGSDMAKIRSLENRAEAVQDENEQLKLEIEKMKKRENWLMTEVILARETLLSSGKKDPNVSENASMQAKRMSMIELEQQLDNSQLEGQQLKITKALIRMAIATQAQSASLKIKEAERIRTGALQEAAYLKAKLLSMSNAQQDPDALARVEMERAADLEKRLTSALNELETLESQYSKVQETLEQERASRLSAEERSNGSALLAEQAQSAHTRALSELSSLHTRAAKAESESREYAAQLAEVQAGFSGHQSQSSGLLQKITSLKQQVEQHEKALERTQMAYSAANERAIRAETQSEVASSKVEKLESLRFQLSSDVGRYKGEAERLQSKVEELETRCQVSKDEVVTLRKLVEDGLGAFNPRGNQRSAERKHDSIAILSTVSRVSELEHELGSLKRLHAASQESASKSASELAENMMELSRLEQSSMQARAETISLQKMLSQEREASSELRSELTRTEAELESKIKELEAHEVQLGLLKDVMQEKGIIAEDVAIKVKATQQEAQLKADVERLVGEIHQTQEKLHSKQQELEEAVEMNEQLETQLDRALQAQAAAAAASTNNSGMSQEAQKKLEQQRQDLEQRLKKAQE